MKFLREYYAQKPLQCILAAAFLLRLVAALFARGYGMHDDHFLILESSGSFVDGHDYNNWLPSSPGNTGPQGHSFFYMGVHYLLFTLLNFLGIASPDMKMYVVRILHAAYSLSIVYFGYKIAAKYAGKKLAEQTAWLLAALWFMPWLSVRNLVEIQCIPFLLWGTWIYLKKDNPNVKTAIYSGLISGVAFSIRFQSLFFLAGFGLALLCQKQFRNAVAWGISALFMMFFIQGAIDMFVWGKPFMELTEYVRYNMMYADAYLKGSPLMYVYLLLGIFLPPVSVFIFIGFFAHWRKYLLLFLPSFIFLLFHSVFVNKQERFILTIVPSVLILGMIGWSEFMSMRTGKKRLSAFVSGSWKFFLVVNFLLLLPITVHYSKKARVESMLYLSCYQHIEHLTKMTNVPMLPFFYLGQWVPRTDIDNEHIGAGAQELIANGQEPRFVLLTDNSNAASTLDSLKLYFPDLVFETDIKPSFFDNIMYTLNSHNKNETLLIYRNQKYFPEKCKK